MVDELPVLLIRVGEEHFCIEDTCTHDGQAMTNGARPTSITLKRSESL